MTEYDGDDITSQHLAALLNDVDPPGPGMEVDGLLVAGRRATRRHRTLLAGSTAGAVVALLVAAVLIVGGPRAAGGQPAPAGRGSTTAGPTTGKPTKPPATSGPCRIQTLSAPVPLGQVFDMDPTGRYVVAGAADNRIVVWTDGVPAAYRVPGSGSVIAAVVNRDGVVAVGIQDGYPPVTRSWIKVGSQFTRLTPATGWDGGSPRGIDSAGNVVTWAFNNSGDKEAGVFYAAGHPNAPHVLPAPSAGGGAAYGIGDNGIIAGNVGDGAYAFYWDSNHHGHKPPMPSGFRHGKGNATAGDWMVGYVAGDDGQPIATRWNLATGKVDVFDGRDQAVDVDRAGDFVGDPFDVSPYLFRAGKFIDLPLPESTNQAGALAMTGDGRTVLGYAQPDVQGPTALLWHC